MKHVLLILSVLVSSSAFALTCAELEKIDYAVATERFGSGEVTITDVAQAELDYLNANKKCEEGDPLTNRSVYCWEAKRAANIVVEGRRQEFEANLATKEALEKAEEQLNRVHETCENEPQ